MTTENDEKENVGYYPTIAHVSDSQTFSRRYPNRGSD